jgi:purine-binding chemotaxis protein CheW
MEEAMDEGKDEGKALEEDTQKGKFLTFALGNEVYGIEIRYVTEIIGIQLITEVPEVPDYVKGIINLRGKIIPVIDVRLKFRKEAMEYDDRTCIIVIDIRNMSVGLIVDHVSEVLVIPDEGIVPPPDAKTGFNNRYIKGIGKVGGDIKLLLECEKLLTDEEVESLELKSTKTEE